MKHNRAILTFVATIVLCPVSARADVGTPLVWASAFHLFLGNALIGLFEGWLLARTFQLPKRRCVWLLIIANYLSAWIGLGLMPFFFHKYGMDIYMGLRITWALVAATYLMTLVVEWPFVALSLRKEPRWFRSSVIGSLLIQSASYILLFGGYWLVSGTSLYTSMQVTNAEAMPAPSGVVMFFISSSDGDVYRTELGTATDIKVMKLGSTNYQDDHLELRESETDANHWDIAAVLNRDNGRVIVPYISTKDRISEREGWKTTTYYGWGSSPFQAGIVTNSDWHIGWAHWPDIGIWARNGSETVRIAYGMPFGGYTPYRVIQLPPDRALVQLDEQICIVDLAARRIARIKKGYGMLAFKKDQIVETIVAAKQPAGFGSDQSR